MMIVLRFQGCFIDVAGARYHRHGKPGAHGPWFRERRTGIRRIFCAFDHAHIVLGLRYCAAALHGDPAACRPGGFTPQACQLHVALRALHFRVQ